MTLLSQLTAISYFVGMLGLTSCALFLVVMPIAMLFAKILKRKKIALPTKVFKYTAIISLILIFGPTIIKTTAITLFG